jgi:hypothetical protein
MWKKSFQRFLVEAALAPNRAWNVLRASSILNWRRYPRKSLAGWSGWDFAFLLLAAAFND